MKRFFRALLIIISIPVIGMILMVVLSSLLTNSDALKENDKLKTEIQQLKAEIERLNNEPEILFAKAYEEKNRNRYEHALYLLQTIRGKYPDYKPDEITATINGYTLAKLKYEAEQEEQNRIAELERQKRIAEREEERRIAEQEAQKRAEQERLQEERIAREKEAEYSTRKWWQGGTLHKATMKEWRQASYENKLATHRLSKSE